MIVTISGSAASGKSKVIGANALVHAAEGKKVIIISDEHNGEAYLRANEYLKLDTSNMDLTVITTSTALYGRGDVNLVFDAILDKLQGRDPDVLMLDLHVIDVAILAQRLQHHLTAKRDKLATVYVTVQTRRPLSIK